MILILCSLQKMEEHPIQLSLIWLILQPYGELEARFFFDDPDLNPAVFSSFISDHVSHFCYRFGGLCSETSNSPFHTASLCWLQAARHYTARLVLTLQAVCQQNNVIMVKEMWQFNTDLSKIKLHLIIKFIEGFIQSHY